MNANATTHDFIAEMEKASGKKLGQFSDQWLYHAANPVLKGSWKYDKGKKQITIHLEQKQSGEFIFDLPVELGIYKKGNHSPQIMKLRMNTKMRDQQIPMDVNPEKIIIDPRTVLLAATDFEEEK
jgi:aminopeptidase N